MNREAFLSVSFPNQTGWHNFKLEPDTYQADIILSPFEGDELSYAATEIDGWQPRLTRSPELEPEVTQDDYQTLVKSAIDFCATNNHKVVCSRSKFFEISTSGERILSRLKKAYPQAYVYLFQFSNGDCWFGASPETLVRQDEAQFQTESLAGTRWNDETFTEKEYREQAVVTESILELLGLDDSYATKPQEVKFGNIRHLHSSINWSSTKSLVSVAKKLHPTAAVAGIPVDEALQFISEFETHDRAYYAGFVAFNMVELPRVAFVNLRCGKLYSNGVQLFAGGGVNDMSKPESEWQETEQKFESIISVIRSNAQD